MQPCTGLFLEYLARCTPARRFLPEYLGQCSLARGFYRSIWHGAALHEVFTGVFGLVQGCIGLKTPVSRNLAPSRHIFSTSAFFSLVRHPVK